MEKNERRDNMTTNYNALEKALQLIKEEELASVFSLEAWRFGEKVGHQADLLAVSTPSEIVTFITGTNDEGVANFTKEELHDFVSAVKSTHHYFKGDKFFTFENTIHSLR